jgi:hypothetical protein
MKETMQTEVREAVWRAARRDVVRSYPTFVPILVERERKARERFDALLDRLDLTLPEARRYAQVVLLSTAGRWSATP